VLFRSVVYLLLAQLAELTADAPDFGLGATVRILTGASDVTSCHTFSPNIAKIHVKFSLQIEVCQIYL